MMAQANFILFLPFSEKNIILVIDVLGVYRKNSMRNTHQDLPFFKTKFGLFLSFVVFVILVFGLIGFAKKVNIVNKYKKQAEAKLEFYQEERSKIQSRLAEINSDEGIERTARENYNLAKEGEGLLVIVEEQP